MFVFATGELQEMRAVSGALAVTRVWCGSAVCLCTDISGAAVITGIGAHCIHPSYNLYRYVL